MTLHLHCGRWWPILCPPSGALRNGRKGSTIRSVCSMMPALSYTHWYTRLPMVHLVTQFTRGSPYNAPRAKVLK